MSLPKFLDFILNGRLYFVDLVTLAKEDPYEGALPLYSDYPVYIKKIVDSMAENYIKNTIIQTLKKLQRSKKYNLNIDKIIKDSNINGNELNDVLGALARYALEEIPKNKELSEEDKSMTKAMLLLWMLASTNSLDVAV